MRARHSSRTAAGSGSPALTARRSERRSNDSKSGWRSNSRYMVGTAKSTVARDATVASSSVGVKPSRSTVAAPARNGKTRSAPSPNAHASAGLPMHTSCGERAQHGARIGIRRRENLGRRVHGAPWRSLRARGVGNQRRHVAWGGVRRRRRTGGIGDIVHRTGQERDVVRESAPGRSHLIHQIAGADDRRRARLVHDVLDLPAAVHRRNRDRDGANPLHGQPGDDEIGMILDPQGDAIARLDPAADEPGGHRVAPERRATSRRWRARGTESPCGRQALDRAPDRAAVRPRSACPDTAAREGCRRAGARAREGEGFAQTQRRGSMPIILWPVNTR